MKAIIVGNGPSILEKENGTVIDSFDVVVRFNNFKTKGFEKHTGTKTNYWFNTISDHKFEPIPERIVWHSWHWNPETDDRYKKLFDYYKGKCNIEKTKKETIEEMQSYVGTKDYFNYSTGAIAIWMVLKDFPEVTITGFDWWKNNAKHHYHNDGKIGTIHKPDKEFVLISKLMNDEKLNFL